MGKLKEIVRNENGLITQPKIDYTFNEEGMIDWRKMIKAEHLVPNRDRTNEADIDKLSDSQLIILLGGIKDLAQIRGYTNVSYSVVSPHPEYVVATCAITWIPNYETEGKEVTFSAIGDASPHNTKSFAKFFLGPIAENRAFVRCVRNFLKINIVAQEELGNVKIGHEESSRVKTDPVFLLKETMKEKGVSFEIIKKKLITEGVENAEKMQSLDDVPKPKILELIARLKEMKK